MDNDFFDKTSFGFHYNGFNFLSYLVLFIIYGFLCLLDTVIPDFDTCLIEYFTTCWNYLNWAKCTTAWALGLLGIESTLSSLLTLQNTAYGSLHSIFMDIFGWNLFQNCMTLKSTVECLGLFLTAYAVILDG